MSTRPNIIPIPVSSGDQGSAGTAMLLRQALREINLRSQKHDHESNVAQILAQLCELLKCLLAHSESQINERIQTLVSTIENFDETAEGLVQTAYRQIEEIAAEMAALEKDSISQTSIDEIDVELERRETERQRVAISQETLENEIVDLKDRIERCNQVIKLSDQPAIDRKNINRLENELKSKEKSLADIVQVVSKNDEEVATLRHYRDALLLIKEGLPDGLIEKKIKTPLKP